jgi:hypothetical protein
VLGVVRLDLRAGPLLQAVSHDRVRGSHGHGGAQQPFPPVLVFRPPRPSMSPAQYSLVSAPSTVLPFIVVYLNVALFPPRRAVANLYGVRATELGAQHLFEGLAHLHV